MHRDGRCCADIYRSGGTVLGDRDGGGAGPLRLLGQALTFGPEEQHAGFRQIELLDRDRCGDVVQPDDRQFVLATPLSQFTHRLVVADVLVLIGNHRSTTIPTTTPDNVDLSREERVRCPHDGADVEIVLEVLDGDMERMPPSVEVLDYRLESPVAVSIDHVPPIAVTQ